MYDNRDMYCLLELLYPRLKQCADIDCINLGVYEQAIQYIQEDNIICNQFVYLFKNYQKTIEELICIVYGTLLDSFDCDMFSVNDGVIGVCYRKWVYNVCFTRCCV